MEKAEIGVNITEKNEIKADNVIINYIAESERETFDSKSFRADMPDLFNEYVKLSAVKPSIRIKIK